MTKDGSRYSKFCIAGLMTTFSPALFVFILMFIARYCSDYIYHEVSVLLINLGLILPVIGLILSIVGVVSAKKKGYRGIRAGVAGIIFSAMGTVISVLVVLFGIDMLRPTPAESHVMPHNSEIESINEEIDYKMKGYHDYYHLTLRSDYSIVRDDNEHYESLTWVIKHNGMKIREMDASDVLVLDPEYQWSSGKEGVTIVYLKAKIDGKYEKVSKAIQYIIEPEKRSHQLEVFR